MEGRNEERGLQHAIHIHLAPLAHPPSSFPTRLYEPSYTACGRWVFGEGVAGSWSWVVVEGARSSLGVRAGWVRRLVPVIGM